MFQTDDKHFQRVSEVVDATYRDQKVDRMIHQTLIRYIQGEFYPTRLGESGPQTAIPLMSLAARAMSRHLISKAPRAMVSIADPELKSWAENGEISTNRRIARSGCVNALREVVDQSMVSLGVLFFAPCYVGTPEGMKLDLAVEAIDRADYGYDLQSPTLEGADFQYHKFRMKIVDIREHPLFDEQARMEVEDNGIDDSQRDETTNFRRAFGSNKNSLYDYAEIFCCYDKPRNKLVYFPRHQPQMRLMEFDWQGPREGPYQYLYYEKPPHHAIPISPLMHLFTKHKAFNVLDMKAIHQQQVQKNILFYSNADKNVAEEVVNAVNNQSVMQENGSVRMGEVGGASQGTVGMAEKQKRDFSYATNGIVDQFMAQAPTLGQERLLRGASNEMLDDMAGWAQVFMKQFCKNVFWFDVRDPDPQPQMIRKQIGKDLSYSFPWTKEHRRFAMEMEFEIDVMPYSYVDKTPQSELADLLGLVQIVQGLSDQAAAQGIMIDVEALVRTAAKMKNINSAYDVLILNQDPQKLTQLLGSGRGAQPSDPGKPNGQYTRRSESDGSGMDLEIMRMMGRNGQDNGAMRIVA